MDKSVNDINNIPFVLDETGDFAVVYKPPRMHSAPLKNGGGDTLVDWYAAQFPTVKDISGRKEGEGGLLHRLDFETHGLALFAKNQPALDFLLTQQEQGNFIKEYSAICQKCDTAPASFPPPPCRLRLSVSPELTGAAIESFFRPFGPGRKQVRPVTDDNGKTRNEIAKDRGGHYRTEIVNVIDNIADNGRCFFTVQLKRGFRHQIRCHLAWIGCPVLNDPIYGAQPDDHFLALRSHALFFPDPASGEQREYRIEALSAL